MKNAELETVALQAVNEGWPHAQTNAIHEEIVEKALGEIVQLQFGTIGGGPYRYPRADHNGSCDHAEAVALEAQPADPDSQAHHQEKE